MDDWQARVLEEHAELQTKTDALFRFVTTQHSGVPNAARELLILQHCAMRLYLDILRQRIETFTGEDDAPLRDTAATLWQD